MTVADNVMLALGDGGFWLDRKGVAARIGELSRSYGLGLDPDSVVENLPLGMRQRVEIVKALMRQADLLVLDEPTSILSPPEVEGLIGVMRKLKAEGARSSSSATSSAKSSRCATTSSCCANGRVAGRTRVADTTRESLAHMMVGRTLASRRGAPRAHPAPSGSLRAASAQTTPPACAACRTRASACAAAKFSRSPGSTATARRSCATR